MFSPVERAFLGKSKRRDTYAGEKVAVIEVTNVYELGKLVAFRFLEWAIANPNGIVALPTGRTPEYFIKTLEQLKRTWLDDTTQSDLVVHGLIASAEFPNLSGLKFVMLDEFFPMLPTHRNSFCNYINLFYTTPLGIRPENVITFDLIGSNVLTTEEIGAFNGIDVDLSLLNRTNQLTAEQVLQKAILTKVQAFCDDVEQRIRSIGGIGFFLGGIGPDGHVAFNQEGADHSSTTRLVNFNYPTAAAAAGDLGGIEIARGKAAMTIGLGTISFNPLATIIIMAAGEGKAEVVRAGIEDPADPTRPSSFLHGLSGGRFYITHGAASKLTARNAVKLNAISAQCVDWALSHLAGVDEATIDYAHMVEPPSDYLAAETFLYNVSLSSRVPVHKLVVAHLDAHAQGPAVPPWLRDPLALSVIVACAARRLREKIEGGLKASTPAQQAVLHTAPHHDDIMLSYHAAMHYMLGREPVREVAPAVDRPLGKKRSGSFSSIVVERALGETFNGNVNHFAYLTSGFHSVNDSFLGEKVEAVVGRDASYEVLTQAIMSGELSRDYDDLMAQFHDAFVRGDEAAQAKVENIIFLRKLAEVHQIPVTQSYGALIQQLRSCLESLQVDYIGRHNPGDALSKEIQLLKGCMRESEVDRVWALSRMPMNRIHHMRSKFYTDDFFTPMPSLEDDALPVANLIKARQPDIITVAFDPEGTGPDTHYKVLQVVAAGLRVAISRGDLANPDPIVWGYRNVWFVFTPTEGTLFIPGSAEDLNLMHATFMSCFTTQKTASFPSPHYDGPFSAWARHLQQQQRQALGCLLGEEYFATHADPRVRNSDGFVFLRAMRASSFLREVEELKSKFENVSS